MATSLSDAIDPEDVNIVSVSTTTTEALPVSQSSISVVYDIVVPEELAKNTLSFEIFAGNLTDAVESGDFTSNLQNAASDVGDTTLQAAYSSSIIVYSQPTMSPTTQPPSHAPTYVPTLIPTPAPSFSPTVGKKTELVIGGTFVVIVLILVLAFTMPILFNYLNSMNKNTWREGSLSNESTGLMGKKTRSGQKAKSESKSKPTAYV